MSGRGLVRRLAKLESQMIPRRAPRVLVRYQGPGSERFQQPTTEEMDDCDVITLRIIRGCEGRPRVQCGRASSGLQECGELCQGVGNGEAP